MALTYALSLSNILEKVTLLLNRIAESTNNRKVELSLCLSAVLPHWMHGCLEIPANNASQNNLTLLQVQVLIFWKHH